MTDKAFTRMMVTSILGIVLCMVALVSMTWAYFGDTVTSAGNTLTAGDFTLNVAVDPSKSTTTSLVTAAETLTDATYPSVTATYQNAKSVITAAGEDFTTNDDGSCVYTATGDANSYSTVTFKIDATMTVSQGYCDINVADQYFIRQYFTRDSSDSLTLTVTLTAGQTVTFTAHWGAPAAATMAVLDEPPAYYITPEAETAMTAIKTALTNAQTAKATAEQQLQAAVAAHKAALTAAETNAVGKTPAETNAAGTPIETDASGKAPTEAVTSNTPAETNAAGVSTP